MREKLLAELELMRDTGREAEAHMQALRLLHGLSCPASNDPNPLHGDREALGPYLKIT